MHLTVTGFLSRDRTVEIESMLPSLGPLPSTPEPTPPDGRPGLTVELVDAEGQALAGFVLETLPSAGGGEESAGWSFLGRVSLDERSQVLAWVVDGKCVRRSPAPRIVDGPRLAWPPSAFEGAGSHVVRWTPGPARGMRYALSYTWDAGEPWLPLGLPSEETSRWVDFDSLPGGEGCVLLLRAGGEGAVSITFSKPFAVARKGVVVTINQPEDGAAVTGGVLHLRGTAYDVEGRQVLEDGLEWLLNDIEPLGIGSQLVAAAPTGDLWITLRHRASGAATTVHVTSAG